MKQIGNKVSYVKNPFAKRSYVCLGLGLAALSLAAGAMYISVSAAGKGGLNTGAFGFSSIAASLMGIWYGILSFLEKDCNYILSRIGISIEVVLMIIWAVIMITGLTG